MKVFGISLLCMVLFSQGINGESGGRLKSELFLTQDAIVGGIMDAPAEYMIKPGPEHSYSRPPGMGDATSLGEYPVRINVPEYNKKSGKESGELEGRTLRHRKKKKVTIVIRDPIKHLVPNVFGGIHKAIGGILGLGKKVVGGVVGGVTQTVEGAVEGVASAVAEVAQGAQNVAAGVAGSVEGGLNVNVNLTIPGAGDLLPKLLECGRKMILCVTSNIFNVQCYLHCMFSAHPVGKEIIGSVTTLMNSLCLAIGTVFDEGVSLFSRNSNKIKTVNHFLTLFQVVPQSFKKFARLAANALPTILIKYANVQPGSGLDLKVCVNSLETAVKSTNKGYLPIQMGDALMNPGCKFIDPLESVQHLVSAVFNKGAKVADIILSGFWTLKKFVTLVTAKAIKNLVISINYVITLLIGTNCDLLSYSMTGEVKDCNPEEQEKIPLVINEQAPDKGMPVVCGSVPLFPRSFIDDIFPPIFEDVRASSTPRPSSPVDGMSGRVGDEAPTGTEMPESETTPKAMDYEWVDKLLKNTDLEYDE